MSKETNKIIARAMLIIYLIAGQDMPVFAVTPAGTLAPKAEVAISLRSTDGTHARQIARAPLLLPARLGSVEEFLPMASTSDQPAILHLQTAHGDFGAQMALARALDYLKEHQGLDTLLLEGADGELEPGLDRFFKQRSWNQEVALERVKTGRMSGAAYFLMSQPEGSVRAFGVEEAAAYRKNRHDFLALIKNRSTIETFLKTAESDLDRLFSKKAARSILNLRRQEKAFSENRLDWAGWMGELQKAALTDLNLDLKHVSSQKEWPSLVRFLRLRDLAALSNNGPAPEVSALLPQPIRQMIQAAPGNGVDFRYGEVRLVLEDWLRQQNQKDKTTLPDSAAAALKKTALQNEIKPEALWLETQALTEKLLRFHAQTPAEKKLLKLDSDLKLLQGLLLTELSFRDYQRVISRQERLRPSRLRESIARLDPASADEKSSADDKTRQAGYFPAMDEVYQTALQFYAGARQREEKIVENTVLRARSSQSGWVVLVTGGFHSAGLREEIAKHQMTYMRMTPRAAVKQEGFSAALAGDPRHLYRQAFLEHSAETESSAFIEDAAVLPVPREALQRLGVARRGFIENRTAALSAWLRMNARADGEEAMRQFNASLFARQHELRLEDPIENAAFVRSEVRAAKKTEDLHKQIEKELRQADEVLHHLPQGAISEFSKVQVLLAALYGGSVQLQVEQARTAFFAGKNNGRPSWEKRSYTFRWGLYELQAMDLASRGALSKNQRKKTKTAAKEALAELTLLGIRAERLVKSAAVSRELTVGEVLTHEPAFQNPFLHTFLGATKDAQTLPAALSRFERAVDLLKNYPAPNERKMTSAEINYLRSFDNVFIPYFKMDAESPFVVRVQHNQDRGPYKGGIRLVDTFTLVHDKHFKALFDDLKSQLNLQELRFFLRKYILEETLPLSFGMTSKASVANLPYGGGKGTMLAAEVTENDLGEKQIEDLHKGQDPTRYLFQLARGMSRVLAESQTAHSDTDIPAADLNSGRYMDAMADEQIEVTYERLKTDLQIILKRRGARLPVEDKEFLQELDAVPQFTPESLEKPFYLEALTRYGDRLRNQNRKIPKWALPLFQAAATYTSKSEKLMGSAFRVESTGYGGIHVLREVVLREGRASNPEKPLQGMTAKLMGLGNVGSPAAEKMLEEGMIIKMISLGPLGAVVKKEGGLTQDEIVLIRKMVAQKVSLSQLGQPGYEAPGVEHVEPEKVDNRLLKLDADVFVLAAVENAINAQNVKKVRGKIFLELANGAITNTAYDRLTQDPKAWFVIPDTVANAGGVTVSYYEWLQNLSNERWTRESVIERLEQQLSGGVARVAEVRKKYQTDWRTAADILMILEVLKARRAEKMKTVRSKNKRSEVRASQDQVGGFRYLDAVKKGKEGVFSAEELVSHLPFYLNSPASQGVFAGAVLPRGEALEKPDFVTWQSFVNAQGDRDMKRVEKFVREKILPLQKGRGSLFEVHRLFYELNEDETEMIEIAGGHRTGLMLVIFPEKTGGGSDSPGGRGQRPWDEPRPFGSGGARALPAQADEETAASSLFESTAEKPEDALATAKKTQRRSEVRAAQPKLLPEEITAARTEEFFAIRDELLAIFSRYKKAKAAGKETEQERLLQQARAYANVLASFIHEIRSGEAAQQQILDSYASMDGKTRQSEAVRLGKEIRSYTPRFVEQWQIYNRRGVADADKQAADAALNRLNAEVVQLAKKRLKLQLLQFQQALEAEVLHQGTLFALLMSITDLYQRIRYEYQWRTFRAGGTLRTARLPMIGALGLVRDNLPYQSEPLLRVESEEQGGVVISQIVWKYKPVAGGEAALIPEMTRMRFPDFPAALRGKEHALESQEQDYAVLADHDFMLKGVKDTLDWYTANREILPEEIRDQLVQTLLSVQAGPNGRYGLARRRARHYVPGARKVENNVLPKPGLKIDLAIADIQTGTLEKLKEASGAIEMAQQWTRARREYIEKRTAPATQRKRDYAYALMRDALLRQALSAVQAKVTSVVLDGKNPGLGDALEAEQNLRGLEQTYFRYIASGAAAEPEIILYKNLQREVRGILSLLNGLKAGLTSPVRPKTAEPTAEALDKKIRGVLQMLLSAAQRRERSLTRSEVRSAAPQPGEQPSLGISVDETLAEAFADKVRYAAIAGRPGAGKGTVTGRFIKELNALLPPEQQFEVLVTGDWFRGVTRLLKGQAEDGDDDRYGAVLGALPKNIGAIMASGDLVSDEVTAQFFNTVLQLPLFQGRRILFDGFPRTKGQLDIVQEGLLFPRMDLFVLIETTEETAVRRILGADRHREDDTERIVRKRMAQFGKHTAPMMEVLRQFPQSIVLNGENGPEHVYKNFLLQVRAFLQGETAGRSEVRSAASLLELERIEAADLLDGLFLPDDLTEWEIHGNTPGRVNAYLEAPSLRNDLRSVISQTAELLSAANPGAGAWLERFPGETLREQEKKTYLLGPELLRRYGPVLIALEQSASEASRLIVLVKNDAEARGLESLVDAVNQRLPKNRRLMMKTPTQARALLKADTLRGLGIGEADAALLRRIIPDFIPLNVFELDAWVSQVPGLTKLIQQFQALSALAASA